MTHANFTAYQRAIEAIVLHIAEVEGIPVDEAWKLVSDIAMDKWEVT